MGGQGSRLQETTRQGAEALPPAIRGLNDDEVEAYRLRYRAFRLGEARGAQGEARQFRGGSPDRKPLNDPSAPREPSRICVIGAGAYGTAMAFCAGRNRHIVTMYARDPDQVNDINTNHRNSKYLGDLALPENIRASTSVADALEGAEVVILALPAQKLPSFLAEHKAAIPPTAVLCNTAKGLVVATKQLLSEAVADALDRQQPYCVLSGPSFAKEIVQGNPTAVAVASRQLFHAVKVQRLLSSLSFRVFTSQDVIGVELGGALKNPLAIGAGVVEGMGNGTNTMAAYVTRSCHELTLLVTAMGGDPKTVAGLSGIGDLMLTAFGAASRNRSCGLRLSQGEPLSEICASYTVEGVPTAEIAVHFMDACGLDLPIFRTVHNVLEGKLAVKDAREGLMSMPLGMEQS
jgi:glycerol-3-phosphate dehydrogenase (NAD+)